MHRYAVVQLEFGFAVADESIDHFVVEFVLDFGDFEVNFPVRGPFFEIMAYFFSDLVHLTRALL